MRRQEKTISLNPNPQELSLLTPVLLQPECDFFQKSLCTFICLLIFKLKIIPPSVLAVIHIFSFYIYIHIPIYIKRQ